MISNTNNMAENILTKGMLGGALSLTTMGNLTEETFIIEVTTKKGKRGSGAIGADYYDKEYWRRFVKEVEDDKDEIDRIVVKISRDYIDRKYRIEAHLIEINIIAELVEKQIIKENQKVNIKIDPIETKEEYIRELRKIKLDGFTFSSDIEERSPKKFNIKTEYIKKD